MATSSPLGQRIQTWPYEYKGWRVTFNVVETPLVALTNPLFKEPLVEHLHEDEKQLVRWTKAQRVNKKTWERLPVKEQLCCFICAVYMPDSVWAYFEKCREMTRCVSLGDE